MRQSTFIAILFSLVILFMSCSGNQEPQVVQSPDIPAGSLQVADEIIYDVVIKNHDPDDHWTEQCLAGLNRKELVDFIFDGLYEGRFKAFDIFNDDPIPVRKIRKMEQEGEISRDQVSKIQFVEGWYIDHEHYTMTKKVTEVRLGMEHFDGFGMHLGHNPLFKVKFVQP